MTSNLRGLNDPVRSRVQAAFDLCPELERLVATAADIDKFLDQLICYPSTSEEHEPNFLVREFRKCLAELRENYAGAEDPHRDQWEGE